MRTKTKTKSINKKQVKVVKKEIPPFQKYLLSKKINEGLNIAPQRNLINKFFSKSLNPIAISKIEDEAVQPLVSVTVTV